MASVSATAGRRMLARRVAAVLCGALMGWSCGGGSSSSSGGFGAPPSAGSSAGGIAGSSAGSPGSGIPMVATLCGDPVCPPLPGEDASTEDMEAGRPVMDGGSEASAHGSMPSCTWPANLDPTDAANDDGACIAGRALLSCSNASGGTSICVSDESAKCPGEGIIFPVGTFTCDDQCLPDEYAISCGSPFPIPPEATPEPPPPPANCRVVFANEGVQYECCPCGSDGRVSDGGTDAGPATDAGGDASHE